MADRERSQAAAPSRWARRLLSGVAVLAVLAGGTVYLARGVLFPGPASGRAAVSPQPTASRCGAAGTGDCAVNPAYVAAAGQPAVVTVPPSRARPTTSVSSSSPSPRPAATTTAAASARPAAPATAAGSATAAGQVLALINQARSAAGLPALTITSGLDASSSAHNLRMAGGCGLSHQCPGEQPLGSRESAAGVDWTSAGENIGEGGPVASTSAAIAQMAVGLTHIGIAVYRDGSGTVWLTQDFSN
jgi:uncharacterized protein YkwD